MYDKYCLQFLMHDYMPFMLNKNIKIIRKDHDENIVDGNIADDTDNGVFEHLFIIDKQTMIGLQ